MILKTLKYWKARTKQASLRNRAVFNSIVAAASCRCPFAAGERLEASATLIDGVKLSGNVAPPCNKPATGDTAGLAVAVTVGVPAHRRPRATCKPRASHRARNSWPRSNRRPSANSRHSPSLVSIRACWFTPPNGVLAASCWNNSAPARSQGR